MSKSGDSVSESPTAPRIDKSPRLRTCILHGLLCAALAFCWQALKVQSEFQGNWTGLFDTATDTPLPPALASENILPVAGYDGQFYHYVAHDPFFRRGFSRFIDNPRLRYGRMFVPLAAYALAGGRADWIDRAYMATILGFVFLGGYWAARYAQLSRLNPSTALLFLFVPATLLSIETLTVDVVLIALCIGFYLFRDAPLWKLFPVLAIAPLVRETGLVLMAAAIASAVLGRRWRRAGICLLAAVPWVCWMWFVHQHTEAHAYGISAIPLSETIRALARTQNEHGPLRWFLDVLDRLAILGSMAAIVLGVSSARKWGAAGLACAGFALVGLCLQHADVWENYHAHTRVLSPLYVLLAMGSKGQRYGVAPLRLVMPRFLVSLLVQIPIFVIGATKAVLRY